jgi:hypothetical protein
MARRRQEIALQAELETQDEWNETISKEGLTGRIDAVAEQYRSSSFDYC